MAGLRCGSNMRYSESTSSDASESVELREAADAAADDDDEAALAAADAAAVDSLGGMVDLVSVTVNRSFP